jgi:hypothetical protein
MAKHDTNDSPWGPFTRSTEAQAAQYVNQQQIAFERALATNKNVGAFPKLPRGRKNPPPPPVNNHVGSFPDISQYERPDEGDEP